jgi:hypothetical protein
MPAATTTKRKPPRAPQEIAAAYAQALKADAAGQRARFRNSTPLADYNTSALSGNLTKRESDNLSSREMMHYLYPHIKESAEPAEYNIRRWHLYIDRNASFNAYFPLYVSTLAGHLKTAGLQLMRDISAGKQLERVHYESMRPAPKGGIDEAAIKKWELESGRRAAQAEQMRQQASRNKYEPTIGVKQRKRKQNNNNS